MTYLCKSLSGARKTVFFLGAMLFSAARVLFCWFDLNSHAMRFSGMDAVFTSMRRNFLQIPGLFLLLLLFAGHLEKLFIPAAAVRYAKRGRLADTAALHALLLAAAFSALEVLTALLTARIVSPTFCNWDSDNSYFLVYAGRALGAKPSLLYLAVWLFLARLFLCLPYLLVILAGKALFSSVLPGAALGMLLPGVELLFNEPFPLGYLARVMPEYSDLFFPAQLFGKWAIGLAVSAALWLLGRALCVRRDLL